MSRTPDKIVLDAWDTWVAERRQHMRRYATQAVEGWIASRLVSVRQGRNPRTVNEVMAQVEMTRPEAIALARELAHNPKYISTVLATLPMED